MLMDPNQEIFRGTPEAFRTPFASKDSRLSDKYQAIAKAAGDPKGFVSIGERLLCQQQAQAWHSGFTLVNFAKATVVGDILADAMPQVAWMSGSAPAGLFAKVAFPQSTNPDDSTPDHKAPAGYRCVAWPTGEERLTGYRRPDEAIVSPACDHMSKMQARCLESTLVCAYVRPEEVDGKEAHGAFRSNKALRDKCIAMRKLLLADEARFRVNLNDVQDTDPAFAQKLRDSGVNNSPAQRSQHLSRLANLPTDDGSPLPEPPPPAGGIAFDDVRGSQSGSSNWKTAIAVGGGTAAAVASAAYFWIKGRNANTG